MDQDGSKETPKIRYLSRREMLGLMGSTAVAITLAGCGGGGEQSGSSSPPSAPSAETTGAGAETASTCVVRPEQTQGPYYVDVGLDRSDIRENREGVALNLTFNVSRLDEGAVRFFLLQDRERMEEIRAEREASGDAYPQGGPPPGGPPGSDSEAVTWVQDNCEKVPQELWQPADSEGRGGGPLMVRALYDCDPGGE